MTDSLTHSLTHSWTLLDRISSPDEGSGELKITSKNGREGMKIEVVMVGMEVCEDREEKG